MSDELTVSFECSNCGPTAINHDDKLGDAAPVTCAACGADFAMTWGELQERAAQEAADSIFNPLVKRLKKSGWQVS